MSLSKKPHEMIRDLATGRASWSNNEILAEIEQLPPLADEDDPIWGKESYWQEVAYLYLALSDVAAERKIRPAVRLLLERACFGDPGEIMRGLRHRCEEIFDPDWTALADVCIASCASKRPGTRWWAIDQMAILGDPRTREVLERALNDEIGEVRRLAAVGLEQLDHHFP
jgi:hypothetical protein